MLKNITVFFVFNKILLKKYNIESEMIMAVLNLNENYKSTLIQPCADSNICVGILLFWIHA